MKLLLNILLLLGVTILIEVAALIVIILVYSIIGAIKDGKENL
jgi:hypothetical protein